MGRLAMGDAKAELKNSEMRMVPLNRLKIPKWDLRYPREKDGEFLKQLQDDFENNGLIEPIVVRPLDEVRYEVVAGVYRMLAMKTLRKKTIPARVVDINDMDAQCMAFRENELRKELDSYKKAKFLARLKQKYNLQVCTLAKKTGLSKATIYKYLKVWREASEETLEKWREGTISFRTAYRRVKTQNEPSEPKPDFFTGRPLQNWHNIRISNDVKKQLETLRENLEKIAKTKPKNDIEMAFFDEEKGIQKNMEQAFGKYGSKVVEAIYTLMKKRFKTK